MNISHYCELCQQPHEAPAAKIGARQEVRFEVRSGPGSRHAFRKEEGGAASRRAHPVATSNAGSRLEMGEDWMIDVFVIDIGVNLSINRSI